MITPRSAAGMTVLRRLIMSQTRCHFHGNHCQQIHQLPSHTHSSTMPKFKKLTIGYHHVRALSCLSAKHFGNRESIFPFSPPVCDRSGPFPVHIMGTSCHLLRKFSTEHFGVVTPLHLQAEKHLERTAICDQNDSFTYSDVLVISNRIADNISETLQLGIDGLKGQCVSILCENDISYVAAQWAIWILDGICVPLCQSHPTLELEYFIKDTSSKLILCTKKFKEKLSPITSKSKITLRVLDEDWDYLLEGSESSSDEVSNSQVLEQRRVRRINRSRQMLESNAFKHRHALIIYTSGTTGKPKGVVMTHGNLQAMMDDMIRAWGWTNHDVILHVLPLHHIHGVINVLMTSLYCGATCVMMPKFDADKVWSRLLSPVTPSTPHRITLFMAVPTIYAKLLERFDQRFNRGRGTRQAKEYVKASCTSNIRLMVSGSAALPEPIMSRWEELTGHRLLERYGMTEIGMGLTNPLNGPRIAGSVGKPFPKVEVMIAKPNVYATNGYEVIARGHHRSTRVIKGMEDEQGELFIRGPSVFREYLNKPEATKETFTPDGWFKTGDIACYQDGVYKILGRSSVDIIKSGGYKISALDIERHLLAHPIITDVAVVGLPDLTWGQRVAAVVATQDNVSLTLDDLRGWCRERLPSYQIPSVLKTVEELPRNAMGKVNKKELVQQIFPKEIKNSH